MHILTYKITAPISQIFDQKGKNELLRLNGKVEINIEDIGKYKIKILHDKKYKLKEKQHSYYKGAFVFTIDVPENEYKRMNIIQENSEVSEKHKKELFISHVSEEFKKEIFYFLVLCNIAYPGVVHTIEGEVFINDILFGKSLPVISLLGESTEYLGELEWPKYRSLKIKQVLGWIEKNNFSFNKYSNSKTQRALNAFTYLFKENILINQDLFWALTGIEALYCSSKDGISRQIYEKTQVFLGSILDFKKRLKEMYDFRSRLVHGDMDFPPSHYDEEYNEKTFNNKLYNATLLAIAILTTTLQEMILNNKSNLTFKYTIE